MIRIPIVVAGQRRRAEDADDAHQANPARLRDQELQNPRRGHAQQPETSR